MRPLPLASGQIVSHPAWTAARDALMHALHGPPGVHALLGPPGTGKTMLLHELDRILRAGGRDVLLLPRGDQEVDPTSGATVLIDEADRMGAEALAALASRADLHLVFAALPAFAARLPGVRPVMLAPLLPEEAAAFLRARTAQSDHRPDLLTEAAVEAIARHAGGAPRVLNALLGLSVFSASLDGAERVASAHVEQALQFRDLEAEIEPPPPPEPPPPAAEAPAPGAAVPGAPAPRRRRRAVALLVLLLLCTGGVAVLLRPDAGRSAPTVPATARPVAPPAAPPRPVPQPTAADSAGGAAEAPALPPRPFARVVLSYPRGDAEAARQGQEAVRVLRAAGIAAGDPVPVGRIPGGAALHYFFTQDRDGAAEIGRALGGRFGEGALAPAARRDPLPRPGTVEILLVPD